MKPRTQSAAIARLAMAAIAALLSGCDLEDIADVDEIAAQIRSASRAGQPDSPIRSIEVDERGDLRVALPSTTPVEELAGLPQRHTREGRTALRTAMNDGEGETAAIDEAFATLSRGGLPSKIDFDSRTRTETLVLEQLAPTRDGFAGDGVIVFGGGTTRKGEGAPGGFADPGGEAIVRYACCPNVWVRSQPADDAAGVTRLDESEVVWLTDLFGVAGLSGGLADGNVWAEVFVPEEGVSGYVPLAALFIDPVERTSGNVMIEVGYRPISDALWNGLDEAFRPEGCEDPPDSITVTANVGHKWWYPVLGQAYSCDDPHESLYNDCAACNETTLPGYQTPYEECVASLPEGALPKDWCQESAFETPICDNFVEDDTTKHFANPRAWRCGEYPFGVTNWDDGGDAQAAANNADRKHVTWLSMWEESHRVTMGRLEDQHAVQFDTFDLTQRRAITRSIDREIGPENFRVSFTPYTAFANAQEALVSQPGPGTEQAYRLGVHVCGHLPGVPVQGPDAEYEPWHTYKNLFERIDFGTMTFDDLEVCAAGTLSVDDDWQPRFEWLEITSFEIEGLNLDDVGVVFAPWVYIGLALGAVLMPIVLGGLGILVSALLAAAAVGSVALPAWINATPSDQIVWDQFVPEQFKEKIFANVLVRMNDATREALEAQVFDAKDRLADACDAALPDVDESSPYYWFYRYLDRQCHLLTNAPTLAPFQSNDDSQANGCYGLNALFEPPTPGANAWWRNYAGQSWYTGAGADAGCRVGFQMRQRIDPELWPVVRCIAAQANTAVNVPGSPAVGALITANCSATALGAVTSLYGDGSDLEPLLDEDQVGVILNPLDPPVSPFDPGLTSGGGRGSGFTRE